MLSLTKKFLVFFSRFYKKKTPLLRAFCTLSSRKLLRCKFNGSLPTVAFMRIFQTGRCYPNNEPINLPTFVTIIFINRLTHNWILLCRLMKVLFVFITVNDYNNNNNNIFSYISARELVLKFIISITFINYSINMHWKLIYSTVCVDCYSENHQIQIFFFNLQIWRVLKIIHVIWSKFFCLMILSIIYICLYEKLIK